MECKIDHDAAWAIPIELCRICGPKISPDITATQVKERIAESCRNAKIGSGMAEELVNREFEIATRLGLLPPAGPKDNPAPPASNTRPASSSKASR